MQKPTGKVRKCHHNSWGNSWGIILVDSHKTKSCQNAALFSELPSISGDTGSALTFRQNEWSMRPFVKPWANDQIKVLVKWPFFQQKGPFFNRKIPSFLSLFFLGFPSMSLYWLFEFTPSGMPWHLQNSDQIFFSQFELNFYCLSSLQKSSSSNSMFQKSSADRQGV